MAGLLGPNTSKEEWVLSGGMLPVLGFPAPHPKETRHHGEPARSNPPRLQPPELSDADPNPIVFKMRDMFFKKTELLKLKSQQLNYRKLNREI